MTIMGTFVVVFTIAFQSCPGKQLRRFKTSYPDQSGFSDSTTNYLYDPLYANNFCIIRRDGEKVLYLKNPVTGIETQQVIKKANRVVCLSSTHIAYLDALNETGSIVGVSGLPYVYNKRKLKAIDVGYESSIDYETLLQLNPDVVFAYSIPGQTAEYLDKIRQLGLNVVEMTEHMENHPLGKAEFLVAFAAFFNKEEMAAEIFTCIDQAYEHFCTLAKQAACLEHKSLTATTTTTTATATTTTNTNTNTNTAPTTSGTPGTTPNGSARKKQEVPRVKVLINAPYKDIWYIPGQESHQNILIEDAGGLLLGSKPGNKTTVISTEQAYLYALEADYWIHPNQYTQLSELLHADPRFADSPALANERIWNNNLRTTPAHGSDYFESGAVNPHLILADLIAIFYPDALPNHKFTYYRQLK
ncbi:MAG TPA: ABC transporter substrate-binding protein [Bacteroidales bacterium]|nr:ABC transporter substrate-binding protein [Bacteroidales bacterium]